MFSTWSSGRCLCRKICSSLSVLPLCWPASPSCFSSASSPGPAASAGPQGGSLRDPGLCPYLATCCSSISADLSKHSARWIDDFGVKKKQKLTKSEFFAILVVQEIWASVHRALWTQESGGSGQSQDRQRGSGRESRRVRGPRHLPDILWYKPRSRYVHPSVQQRFLLERLDICLSLFFLLVY